MRRILWKYFVRKGRTCRVMRGKNSNEILNFKKIVIKRGIEMGAMRCMV
jgi:hypothetical protein